MYLRTYLGAYICIHIYIYALGSRAPTPPPWYPPPPACGLNRVYLAAGCVCVCVGRTPRASCQIDPIWCSSVSGPRELNNLNNLNPGGSPIFKLFNWGRELNNLNSLNNLNNLNPGEGVRGEARGRELNNLNTGEPPGFKLFNSRGGSRTPPPGPSPRI